VKHSVKIAIPASVLVKSCNFMKGYISLLEVEMCMHGEQECKDLVLAEIEDVRILRKSILKLMEEV
jgi:hypothetical protein